MFDVSPPNLLAAENGTETTIQPELPDKSSPIRKSRRGWWWKLPLLVLALIMLALAPLVYLGGQAAQTAWRMRGLMERFEQELEGQNLSAAELTLSDIEAELQTLQSQSRPIRRFAYTPLIGPYVRTIKEAETAAEVTLVGVRDMLGIARDFQEALQAVGVSNVSLESLGISSAQSFKQLNREQKRYLLARVSESLPRLRLAREKFRIAKEQWVRVPQAGVSPALQQTIRQYIRRFVEMEQTLHQVVDVAEVVVPLAGYPQEKTYLVILQNSEELRATGGFIGTVGIVSIDAGEFTRMEFGDVYGTDNPAREQWTDVPPYPLQRWLEQKAWFLRDSNWSPDFPQTAERLLDVYHRERAFAGVTSTRLDGVIALQPKFFERLLQITGPIMIENKIFTAANFFDQLEYDVEVGFLKTGVPRPQRKEIVAKVGEVLWETLTHQPSSLWPDIWREGMRSLEEKDALVYVRQPQTLALLDARQWTGRTLSSAQDFLWVVDTNMAAMKTDGVMRKDVIYAVDASRPSGAVATLTLRYKNLNKKPDWRYTRYRDYVRVYAPEGSEFISVKGAMADDKLRSKGKVIAGQADIGRELGKTVFGAFWAIEPGETRELTFTYRLPAFVPSGAEALAPYALVVQKQPGSKVYLTLDHLFGKNLVSARPAESSKEFGDARYRITVPLTQDRTFEVHRK